MSKHTSLQTYRTRLYTPVYAYGLSKVYAHSLTATVARSSWPPGIESPFQPCVVMAYVFMAWPYNIVMAYKVMASRVMAGTESPRQLCTPRNVHTEV